MIYNYLPAMDCYNKLTKKLCSVLFNLTSTMLNIYKRVWVHVGLTTELGMYALGLNGISTVMLLQFCSDSMTGQQSSCAPAILQIHVGTLCTVLLKFWMEIQQRFVDCFCEYLVPSKIEPNI